MGNWFSSTRIRKPMAFTTGWLPFITWSWPCTPASFRWTLSPTPTALYTWPVPAWWTTSGSWTNSARPAHWHRQGWWWCTCGAHPWSPWKSPWRAVLWVTSSPPSYATAIKEYLHHHLPVQMLFILISESPHTPPCDTKPPDNWLCVSFVYTFDKVHENIQALQTNICGLTSAPAPWSTQATHCTIRILSVLCPVLVHSNDPYARHHHHFPEPGAPLLNHLCQTASFVFFIASLD